MRAADHYSGQYFDWQRSLGQFYAKATRFRFAPYIKPSDRVVDFGCGGAALLATIPCRERRGIEINPTARAEAQRNGVSCVETASQLHDSFADVVISFHALEHTEDPLGQLRGLLPKIRPGGLAVFCVPHETANWKYVPGDINQHLFTWSPMAIGNLFRVAGFEIVSVTTDKVVSPPGYRTIYALLGLRAFRAVCKVYRAARVLLSPIKVLPIDATVTIVAQRPKAIESQSLSNT